MNTCKECGKGFCQSRVRKIYGLSNPGYCSPTCFTAAAMRIQQGAVVIDKDEKEKALAGKIFDELSVHGFIDDAIAINPNRFAEGVKVIVDVLKGEKE